MRQFTIGLAVGILLVAPVLAQPRSALKPNMVHTNVHTDFNPTVEFPTIDASAYVHPQASVIGNVTIGKRVLIAPQAAVRGDEGQPIFIGDESNVQDGVVLHALETESHGKAVEKNLMEVGGKKYAVYIGQRVSLAHQSQVHGPAVVEDDTFVGMQALVFKARVGKNCVLEPRALLMGVTLAAGRYVPAGTVLTKQADADTMPEITDDYPFKTINQGVLHVNTKLANGYNGSGGGEERPVRRRRHR